MISAGNLTRHAENRRSSLIYWVALCIWLLVLVTFTSPGRHGVQTTSGLDLLALVKIISRLVSLLILGVIFLRLESETKWSMLMRLMLPLALFCTWSLLSVTWSANPALSLAQAGCFSILVLLAIVISLVIKDSDDISYLLAQVSYALFALSMVLVIAHFCFPHLGALYRPSAGEGATGILHPTTASSAASLALIILVLARFWTDWKWCQTLLLPGIIMHGFVMYWTTTRTTLALTSLILVINSLLRIPLKSFRQIATLLACVVLGLFIADPGMRLIDSASSNVYTFLARGQTLSQLSSLSGREQIWQFLWDSFWDSPIRGHGFYVTTARGDFYIWSYRANYTAHNLILQALTTTGVVGLFLLSIGLFVPLQSYGTKVWKHQSPGYTTILLTSLWVWYLGWSMLNVSFLAPFQPESCIFFMTIGIAAAISNSDYQAP